MIVGITGGIGSGKSILCKVFSLFGISIYNADEQAKLLMNSAIVKDKIIKKFGSEIYNLQGELNKSLLASIIFNDSEALKTINSIVHPEVKRSFNAWVKIQKSPYVILESAILFESGFYKEVDKIVTIYAPKKLRIKRVATRSKITKSEILSRMKNQLDHKNKIKQSDWIVCNNDKKMILPQVITIHNACCKA